MRSQVFWRNTFQLFILALAPVFAISTSENNMKPAEVKKVTPILFAQELEPCIKFWTERLGFQKTVEVPEGNKTGFVILEKNGLELMYQSFSSAAQDNAAVTLVDAQGKRTAIPRAEIEELREIPASIKASVHGGVFP